MGDLYARDPGLLTYYGVESVIGGAVLPDGQGTGWLQGTIEYDDIPHWGLSMP